MKRRSSPFIVSALLLSMARAGLAQSVPIAATQLPTGASVVGGQANIQSAGAAMTVNQTSSRAVIDWNTFNVGSQAKLNFNQPSASAVVLNRVLDSNPSQILGQLSATGQVFISNPNGVIFGTSARVDVGGLVATTQSMSAADFMAGKNTFSGGNADASVVNQGTLQAALGGYIALLAPKVRNEGVIVAREGTVALAAGAQTTLEFTGTRLVSVMVAQPVLDALVENKQLIRAEGGYVVMSARSASTLMRAVINNTGTIQAPTLVEKQGRIVLEGGTQGIVQVGGNLIANGTQPGEKGGSIVATGDKVSVTSDAQMDASGPAGGGKINIGGGWQGQDASIRNANATVVESGAVLKASATDNGNGGEVVVYSDTQNSAGMTRVAGELLARGGANGGNGGRIETSGHWLSTDGAKGSASAAKGEGGQWLFDPYNVTITGATSNNAVSSGTWTASGSPSTIANTAINDLLNAGTNVTVTTTGSGTDAGNINVNAAITQSNTAPAARLTLSANQEININSAISMSKSGSKLELISSDAGGKVAIKADVNADTLTMTLPGANSSVSQDLGTTVTTSNLRISGTDTSVALNNPTNNVGILAANVKSILLSSDTGIDQNNPYGKGLYVGTVEGLSGVTANGGSVNLSSNSNLYVTQNVASTSTGNDAVTLNAGAALTPGAYNGSDSAINPYGPNVVLTSGKTITTGTGGRATLYMGSASGSGANVATYVNSVSGSGRFRYNSDEGITRFTALSPTASGLYVVLRQNPTLTVTANNSSMVYGSTLTPSTSSSVTGFINGDTLAQAVSTAASIAVGGTQSNTGYYTAGNHTLTPSAAASDLGYGFTYATGTLNVTPKSLTTTATVAGGTKVYDGNTSASTQLSLTGVVSTDNVLVSSASSVYADKNVGTGKSVTVSGLTLSGVDAANYSLASTSVGTTGNITKKNLTATYAASNKIYDGNTSVSVAGSSADIVGSDVVTFTQSAAFQDANAGTGKTVNVSSIALGGTDAGNYNLTVTTASTTANITPKTITQVYSAANKEYDRTTNVTLTQLSGASSQVVAGDNLTFTYTGANFSDWNAGNNKTVNINGLTMGGTSIANYTLSPSASSTTATITQKALSVSGITAANKVYDGTRDATVTAAGAVLSGLVAGDSIAVASTGQFVTKDVGIGKTVNLQNTYTGSSLTNYSITDQVTTTANVSQAQLAVTATAQDKTYDGTRTVNYSLSSNKFGNDAINIAATSAVFDSKDAGVGNTVRVSGISISGSDAANYTLQNTATTTTATINKKALTIAGTTAADKTYDGNNTATMTVGTLSGFVGTETVTASAAGTFDSTNAGSRTATAVYTLANGTNGGLANNYSLANTTANATINKKVLTVTGTTAADKTYDGTDTATMTVGALSGFVGTETVTASASGTFDSKNAGARTATAVYTLANGTNGGLANNYALANTTANATINKASITVTGLNAASRTYDGTTDASLSVSAVSGLVGSETLAITATGSFDAKDAGLRTATANFSVANGTNGGLASNYQLTSATGTTTATINPKALTITGTTAADKTYDGNNTATMTVGTLSGFVGTETVTASAAGTFDSANAGSRTATAVYTLANGTNGGLANNYSLANTTANATINKKVLTVTGTTAADKTYDGTDTATMTVGALSGFVGVETVTASASGTFDSKNAGARTATAVYTLANGTNGGLANNYALANTTANATINKKALTVTGTTAADRDYDGGVAASITVGTLSGMVGSETVTATAVGTFDAKDAGARTATAVYTLGNGTNGGLANNYSLANTTAGATINKKALTVTGTTAADRDYDGGVAASITVGTLGGFVGSETVTATATGTFDSKNAGARTATAVYTLANGANGGLAANYALANTTANATINKKALTVTGTTAADRVYDNTTQANVTVGTLSGFVGSETVTATATGTFDSKNVGARTATAVYTLANGSNGGLAANYTLANTTANATITPKTLTTTGVTADNKVYDGTSDASLNFTAATLTSGATNSSDNKYYSGDAVTIDPTQAKGTFTAGPVWGFEKAVAVTGVRLSGADANNYTVSDVSKAKADIYPVQISSVCFSGGTAGGCLNVKPTVVVTPPAVVVTERPSTIVDPVFSVKASSSVEPPQVIRNTSVAVLAGPPISQASNLSVNTTGTSIESMSMAQVRSLPTSTQNQLLMQIEASSNGLSSVAALNNAASSAVSTLNVVRGLSNAQLTSLSSTQIEAVLSALSPQQLLTLNATQVAALSATSRAQLIQQINAAREVRALNAAQISNLSSSEVVSKLRLFSDTQLLALTDTQVSSLSQEARSLLGVLMTQNQALRQLTAAQIAVLPPARLAVLLPYLDATQLMAITASQTRALAQASQQELGSLLRSVADIRALSTQQVTVLTPTDIGNMMAYMGGNQLLAITVSQASGLTPLQRQDLANLLDNVAKVRSLSNGQITAMSASQLAPLLRFMSPSQLMAISDRQVSTLPPAQVGELLAQLEAAANGRN
jgi:filamentous hemagglutinin family protein